MVFDPVSHHSRIWQHYLRTCQLDAHTRLRGLWEFQSLFTIRKVPSRFDELLIGEDARIRVRLDAEDHRDIFKRYDFLDDLD